MRTRLFLVAMAAAVGIAGPAALAWAAPTHAVKQGETLSEIAAKVRIPLAELARANQIADPDRILAGQTLVLPAAGGGGGASTGYVVKAGDSLSGVAARLGVPEKALAAANRIPDPDDIKAGQVLVLPAAGGGASGGVVVGKGETLSAVAARVGVPVARLAEANGIPDPDLVPAGKVLTVPAGAAPAGSALAAGAALPAGRVLTVPGTWVCPVKGATFVNDFGYQRPDAPGTSHQGVDLFAPRGTPVVAPVSGVVGRYPNDAGGLAFQLFGDDGVRYYGAHLEADGAVGPVKAGTVIGYVGTTGDARGTSPHLHLESHPGGGAAVNPYPTLVGACR